MADRPDTIPSPPPAAAGPGRVVAEERYRTFFDHCPVSLWEFDVSALAARFREAGRSPAGGSPSDFPPDPAEISRLVPLLRLAAVNRATLELYEAADVEELRAGFPSIFTEESAAPFREIALSIAGGARFHETESVNRTLRGRRIVVGLRFSFLPGGEGAAPRLLMSALDLTERKRAEEALRASERRWHALVETSAAWIWETDARLRHVYTNAFVTRCLGYSPAEFLGIDTLSLLHPDDRARVEAIVRAAAERGEGWSEVALRWRHRDGGYRLVESSGSPVFDGEGRFAGLRGLDRDVTERAAAEERLRESEERFRAMAEGTSDWLWEVDEAGRYTYSNPKVAELLGYSPEEVLGKTPFHFMPPDEAERMERRFGELAAERRAIAPLENANLTRDGRRVVLETSAVPILDGEGAFHGYRGIDRDVTGRHLLEAERLKSQKLESIGTLAGGIAHDFNNLLHGVFGFIAMAKISLDQKERAFALLGQAEKALHLSVDLTSRLLTFSKGGMPVKARIALAPVVETAARFALSGSGAAFRFEADPALLPVEADEAQLSQVVQNLVLNAVQAMPRGGLVTVSVRNVPAGKEGAAAGEGARGHVAVEVRDRGEGIAPEVLPKVFDPYFTTKERGSGLGLATAYSIARNHGGRIEVSSEVGRGSTFRVLLPAAPEAAPGEGEGGAGGRVRRILLMDDEEMVRSVAAEQLRFLGYEVVLAAEGEEALEKFRRAREEGKPVDAAILDLTIRGGLGGRETLARLLELDPSVAAVASSGYSAGGTASEYRALGFRAFLKKPYGIEALREALRPLLP